MWSKVRRDGCFDGGLFLWQGKTMFWGSLNFGRGFWCFLVELKSDRFCCCWIRNVIFRCLCGNHGCLLFVWRLERLKQFHSQNIWQIEKKQTETFESSISKPFSIMAWESSSYVFWAMFPSSIPLVFYTSSQKTMVSIELAGEVFVFHPPIISTVFLNHCLFQMPWECKGTMPPPQKIGPSNKALLGLWGGYYGPLKFLFQSARLWGIETAPGKSAPACSRIMWSHRGPGKGRFSFFSSWEWNHIPYCWWFRNPEQPPGMFLKPVVNKWGYLPYQLVMVGFLKQILAFCGIGFLFGLSPFPVFFCRSHDCLDKTDPRT